jgi:protein-L-isoaspartate(D-aspartate) O-methyltransferase
MELTLNMEPHQFGELVDLITDYERCFGGGSHYDILEKLNLAEAINALRISIGTRTRLNPPFCSGKVKAIRAGTSQDAFCRDRKEMVRTILRYHDLLVTDRRVLRAMRQVPRESFVPEILRPVAYRDSPLPIGWGQTISQPYVVAVMTALLQLKGEETILEVGTGSGYQAAILSLITRKVYSIEIIPELAVIASKTLKTLGYENVEVRSTNGFYGWPEAAPFDGMLITCGAMNFPSFLAEQLKVGGKAVIPIGSSGLQCLTVITKHSDHLEQEPLIPVSFVPLTGLQRRGPDYKKLRPVHECPS